MVLANMITDRTIQAFSWMLIHSLWQGLLISVIAGLALMLARRSSAVFRYNLALSLFFFFLLVAFSTFLYELSSFDIGALRISRVYSYAVDLRIFTRQLINYFSEHSFVIAMLWFIVFTGKSLSMAASMIYLRRARHYQTHAVSQYWINRTTLLCEKLQIDRAVTLLESGYVKAPVVLGHLKPIILIPLGLMAGLPAAQIEAVLLHELAHIRRNDYAVNFMQNIAEAIFFFNPGLIWISSLIREEREHCCDDIAIAAIDNKEEFVEALISFKEYSIPAHAYALAFAGQKSSLLNRVMRIVYQENKSFSNKEKGFFMAGIFVLLITCFGFVQVKNSEQVKKQLVKISRTIKTAVAEQLNTEAVAVKPLSLPKKIDDDILFNEPGLVIPVKKVNRKLVKDWAATKNKWSMAWEVLSDKWNGRWRQIVYKWELIWDENAEKWDKIWADHANSWSDKIAEQPLPGTGTEIETLKRIKKDEADSLDLSYKTEISGFKTAYNTEMTQFRTEHHKMMDEMRALYDKEIGQITGTFVPEKKMNTPTLKYKDRFLDSAAAYTENERVKEFRKRYDVLMADLDTIKQQQLDQYSVREELLKQWNDYLSDNPFVSRAYYWKIIGIDTQYDVKEDGRDRYFDKSWRINKQYLELNPEKVTAFDIELSELKDQFNNRSIELHDLYVLNSTDRKTNEDFFIKRFEMHNHFVQKSKELRALIARSPDDNDTFIRKITQLDLEISCKKDERNDKTNQRNNEVVAENFRMKSDLEKLAIRLAEKAGNRVN